MKVYIFNILFVLFTTTIVSAQTISWIKSFGDLSRDVGRGVATDDLGNVISAGYFSGQITIEQQLYEGRGRQDVYLSKYSSNGTLLWVKTAGGSSDDIAVGVAVDAANNIYVTGIFDSTALFDNILITSNGKKDAFIAKYNPDGDLLWVRKAGGIDEDKAFAIAVDDYGDVYFSGAFKSFAAFGNKVIVSKGNDDIFIAKFDTDGNLIWINRAGGSQEDMALGIATDSQKGCYITGSFMGRADFGSTELFTPSVSSEIFIAKIDSFGLWEWAEQAGSLRGDQAFAIAVDKDRNSYITGFFTDEAFFNQISVKVIGFNDVFIAKYNSKGLPIWVRTFGSIALDIGTGIAVSDDGDLIVSGSFDSIAVFNNQVFVGSGFEQDFFVSKWDIDGNFYWVNSGGGPNFQLSMGTALGNNKDIYVVGYYFARLEFEDTTLIQNQDADVFLIKYSDPLLSANNLAFKKKMKIYPNPAHDFFQISYAEIPLKITITDLLGNVYPVHNESHNPIFLFQTHDLNEGIYFVNSYFPGGYVTHQKVLILK